MTMPDLRPLSVGEILDATFAIYRRQFPRLFTIAVVSLALPYALNTYIMGRFGVASSTDELVRMFAWLLISMVLFAVFQAVATAATVHIVSESYLGNELTVADAFRRTGPSVWRLILVWLSVSLLVFLGAVFFLVPGIILALGLAFSTQVLVLERVTPLEAMRRSWALARGSKGKIFLLMITVGVILFVVLMGSLIALMFVSFFVGSPEPGESAPLLTTLSDIVVLVVQLLIFPILPCLLTVTYYDLRVRKEGFDLEVLAAAVHGA
jgi:hypothetical protein